MLSPAPEIRFFEAQDGYRFATRVWEIENPAATIVLVHGIVSHGGWYLASGAHLAQAGFDVHFLDRRGSGLNALARGDVVDWTTWISDLDSYLTALPRGRPRILLGISWGGTLAAAFARQHPAQLQGLGLICPGLYSKKAPNVLQRGALRLAGFFGLGSRRVAIPLKDPALFTNSATDQSYVVRDPLALRYITMRMALANLALTRYATESPGEIVVPTLLMLAQRDPITENPRVRQFAERISGETRVIEYPGASHTLEFEPDPSTYWDDLATWCRDVCERAASG